MNNQLYVIGAGGVGSWLTPALCLLSEDLAVQVWDGDTLEDKNLNRQLFTFDDVGKNKAEALADKYGCASALEYYADGMVEHLRSDWLFCCVDNNPARLSVLRACDRYGCQCIVAANETFSSEAYVYRREWRDTRLDPRVYAPEMLTDSGGDPRAAAMGCTGLAQQQTPQLVTSNLSAASLAAGLFVLWAMELPRLDQSVIPNLPYRRVINLSKMEEFKVGEL